ncbi:MAG: T9SS type A sorting domain-containing protein, partial [bacterium]|nr:T9SS type A sorting domain-containing protein [bacterium]
TDLNTGYVTGDTGMILKTTNAGDSWIRLTTGINRQKVNCIHFLNANTGIAGCDSGKILKTTNAGNSWMTKFSGEAIGVRGIWYLNPDITVGISPSYVCRSTNGGEDWFIQTGGPAVTGVDVYFSDSITGIIAAQFTESFKTTNAGANWFRINDPGINGGFFSIQSINNSLTYGVGTDGYMLKTTNGGVNWIRLPRLTTNSLYSVFFIDENTGYAAGDYGTLIKTTNGGMTFITNISSSVPEDFELGQNYPNPFNPSTTISYKIQKSGLIQLKLFDVTGREITSLVDQQQSSGEYKVLFDASAYPSGIYFYSLYSNGILLDSKKCLLVK